MNYSCVFQVLASDVGSGGDSGLRRGKNLLIPQAQANSSCQGFSNIQSLLEKRVYLFGAFVVLRALNWIPHVTTSKLCI